MKRSTMKYQLGITTTLAIAVSASAALSDSYQRHMISPSTNLNENEANSRRE